MNQAIQQSFNDDLLFSHNPLHQENVGNDDNLLEKNNL